MNALAIAVSGVVLVILGVYSVLTSRNLMRMMASLEVTFNGVLLIVIVLAVYTYSLGYPGAYAGLLVLAAIVLTAVEVAVLAAAILLTYRVKGSVMVDKVKELRG
jgi:NADH:ubiquinone oxidoreductase subunit K